MEDPCTGVKDAGPIVNEKQGAQQHVRCAAFSVRKEGDRTGVCMSVPAKGKLQEGQSSNKGLLTPDKVPLFARGES